MRRRQVYRTLPFVILCCLCSAYYCTYMYIYKHPMHCGICILYFLSTGLVYFLTCKELLFVEVSVATFQCSIFPAITKASISFSTNGAPFGGIFMPANQLIGYLSVMLLCTGDYADFYLGKQSSKHGTNGIAYQTLNTNKILTIWHFFAA